MLFRSVKWGSWRFTRSPGPVSRIQSTRSIRICCAALRSNARIRCGALILRISGCGVASCIWWRLWIGTAEPSVLAVVQHLGCEFLCRRLGRGHESLRDAGNLQHGPGIAVHWPGFHAGAQRCRRRHLNGWQRPVDG